MVVDNCFGLWWSVLLLLLIVVVVVIEFFACFFLVVIFYCFFLMVFAVFECGLYLFWSCWILNCGHHIVLCVHSVITIVFLYCYMHLLSSVDRTKIHGHTQFCLCLAESILWPHNHTQILCGCAAWLPWLPWLPWSSPWPLLWLIVVVVMTTVDVVVNAYQSLDPPVTVVVMRLNLSLLSPAESFSLLLSVRLLLFIFLVFLFL